MRKYPGIYQIVNKITGQTYIGSSSRCVFGRWRRHLDQLLNGVHANFKLQMAWDENGQANFEFSIRALTDDLDGILALEQHHIDMCDPALLFNMCPVAGTTRGLKFSEKSCLKMRKPKSPEHREKIRLALTGKRHDPERVAKQIGKKRSPEARARMSSARKKWKPTAEHRAKIALASRGRKLTPEACAKISIRQKLRWQRYRDQSQISVVSG